MSVWNSDFNGNHFYDKYNFSFYVKNAQRFNIRFVTIISYAYRSNKKVEHIVVIYLYKTHVSFRSEMSKFVKYILFIFIIYFNITTINVIFNLDFTKNV